MISPGGTGSPLVKLSLQLLDMMMLDFCSQRLGDGYLVIVLFNGKVRKSILDIVELSRCVQAELDSRT